MRVLILSTFGNQGGAAVCSRRLKQALLKHGVEIELGVVHAFDGETSISLFRDNYYTFLRKWFFFIYERLWVLKFIKGLRYLYKFSTGTTGFDLSQNPLVKRADIIHLHWINFGFISIEGLACLSRVKPVIWTLHDMWAFTGGCHYTLECTLYQQSCQDCFYLKTSGLSRKILSRKINSWENETFRVVATSKWLADCANKSVVFRDRNVDVLSTPVDTQLFRPLPKKNIRRKYNLLGENYFVLFGAVDLGDERKGFSYLVEAMKTLNTEIPGLHLLTFGKMTGDLPDVPNTIFGQISSQEKLNELYNLADVFVLPSIQDNLPNTVMEAMSCGVPVVAFNCGGVKDMVDHLENGYIARNRDSSDLVRGIKYFADPKLRGISGENARIKITGKYNEQVIAEKHIKEYQKLIYDYGTAKED